MNIFNKALKDLASWFENEKRGLPWRDDPDIYKVWVSEIMLQQTQVKTVIPYFKKFMKRFSNIRSLAEASLDEVLLYWAGLGYYSRARNLHKTAQIILKRGSFPETKNELLKLPGIGQYSAGAILSIALNQPEPILDANIKRVFSRVRCINNNKKRFWRISKIFVKTGFHSGISPSSLNQALMELGAMVCFPLDPSCGTCPLINFCKAKKRGEITHYPQRQKKKWIQVEEEVMCILDQGKVLLNKRPEQEWRSGLYDLPYILQGIQEKDKELIKIASIKTRHVVTHHKILRLTHVYRFNKKSNFVNLKSLNDYVWFDLKGLNHPDIALGASCKKTLKRVYELINNF